jgi:hypothetical protein
MSFFLHLSHLLAKPAMTNRNPEFHILMTSTAHDICYYLPALLSSLADIAIYSDSSFIKIFLWNVNVQIASARVRVLSTTHNMAC